MQESQAYYHSFWIIVNEKYYNFVKFNTRNWNVCMFKKELNGYKNNKIELILKFILLSVIYNRIFWEYQG